MKQLFLMWALLAAPAFSQAANIGSKAILFQCNNGGQLRMSVLPNKQTLVSLESSESGSAWIVGYYVVSENGPGRLVSLDMKEALAQMNLFGFPTRTVVIDQLLQQSKSIICSR